MSIMKRSAAVAMAVCMLLLLCMPALAASGSIYALRATTVRETPTGKQIGVLQLGEVATVLGTQGKYTQIDFRGTPGYVLTSDVAEHISSPEMGDNTYRVTASVTVRSEPRNRASTLGKLSKGETIEGLEIVGNFVAFMYNGKKAYVASQSLTPANPQGDTSVVTVFACTKTPLTEKAGKGKTMGYVDKGMSAEQVGISGQYYQVTINGVTGYAPKSAFVEVAGTGKIAMSAKNKWMYAKTDRIKIYDIPQENNNYARSHLLILDEPVWMVAANEYWAQVFVSDEDVLKPMSMYYVPLKYLNTSRTKGTEYGKTGTYQAGTRFTIKSDAGTYRDIERNSYIAPYETQPYGSIQKGTEVIAMYRSSDFVLVCFKDDRPSTGQASRGRMHIAFVDMRMLV